MVEGHQDVRVRRDASKRNSRDGILWIEQRRTLNKGIRRLPENKIPDCAGFLFGFKARKQAHSELCNCWSNAEAGQKDQQDGIFFDRNRLSAAAEALERPVGLSAVSAGP